MSVSNSGVASAMLRLLVLLPGRAYSGSAGQMMVTQVNASGRGAEGSCDPLTILLPGPGGNSHSNENRLSDVSKMAMKFEINENWNYLMGMGVLTAFPVISSSVGYVAAAAELLPL